MQNKKVSVIIPVYNTELYLRRCLDSIINQTYKNLQIIIVNDGSTDSSLAICNEYANKDERICLIQKINEGQSVARNLGLDISEGEYITFVDSDDWIEIDMIENLIITINNHKADLVQFKSRQIYKEKIIQTKDTGREIICDNKKCIDLFINEKYFTSSSCYRLYKKEIIKDLRFPIGKIHEDEYFSFYSFYNSSRVVFKDITMYNVWRNQANSTMTKKYNEKRLDLLDILNERIEFLEDNKLNKLALVMKIKYLGILQYSYCMCRLNKINNLDYNLNRIKENWKKYYKAKEVFNFKENSYINKIKLIVFGINKSFYYYIFLIKLNINKCKKYNKNICE